MVIIETNRLTKRYGEIEAVKDLDLVVEQGEIFGFLGPNGAGKTTTIKMFLNLVRPTAGSAKVFNLDIGKDSVAIRLRIGYVSEEANMYEWMTPDQLLDFVQGFYGARDAERKKTLAEQFDLPMDRKIKTFSRGMKQKLYLMQALIHDPELLVLDEPTTGLDPIIRNEVLEMIKKEKEKGRTVFLSSHVLSEVEKVCDTVGILREGRLLTSKKLSELKKEFEKKGKAFTLDDIFMAYMEAKRGSVR